MQTICFMTKQYCNKDNKNDFTNESTTQPNKKWQYIPDHPYRILITGGSGNIDKIYLYAKDP